MIEAKGVFKSFVNPINPDDIRKILEDISLICERGKTTLIIGGSGSGKTVLMKCMVGLLENDKGEIFYDGRNFSAMNFKEKKTIRQEIGMVFQGGAIFDSLNVEENVMFPLAMFSDMNDEERKERVNFCLKRVNLINVNKFSPSELSGGMKKRVAIARAIAMNPRYLFCDEPNSGLDPQTAIVIDNLIKEITEEYKITTVINTHDMNSVLEMGDKIIYLYKGRKWWEGDSQHVLKSGNPELDEFLSASKLLRSIKP